jgi:hypothetical protein
MTDDAVRYVRSGDGQVAYRVVGSGPSVGWVPGTVAGAPPRHGGHVAGGLALPRELPDRTEVSGLRAVGTVQLLGDVGRYAQAGAAKIAD